MAAAGATRAGARIYVMISFLAALALLAALDGEKLHYTVNWPSGLSLGEGEFQAKRIKGATPEAERWEFQFRLEAAVPGFQVKDRYRSVASGEFCGVEFSKETAHGARRANETTTISPGSGAATRTTKGGGSSVMQGPLCGKDALTFLYFLRSELIRGRVPPPQVVLSGAAYQVRVEYRGRQSVTVAEAPVEADRVVVSVKGPASQNTFDVYFARDAVRTPLVVSLPLASGVFRMELVR
ncbi:MAG: DUF3108 domain-containing protein [Acidobacteria bacterium]|nr:DUF3108 domain-containing protein [Acidobacteriota bacterium]